MPDWGQMIRGFGLGLVGSRDPRLAAQIGQGWKQQALQQAEMDFKRQQLAQAMKIKQTEWAQKAQEAERQRQAMGELDPYSRQFTEGMVQPDPLGPGTVGTPPRQLTAADLLTWSQKAQAAGMDPGAINNLINQIGPKVVAEGSALQTLTPMQPGASTRMTQPYSPERKAQMGAETGLKQAQAGEAGIDTRRKQMLYEMAQNPNISDELRAKMLGMSGGGVTVQTGEGMKPKDFLPFAQQYDNNPVVKSYTEIERFANYANRVLDDIEAMKKSGDVNYFGKDMALANSFVRIIDPNSVVRAHEYNAIAGQAPLVDRLKGAAIRVIQGGEKFTDADRIALVGLINSLRQEATLQLDRVNNEFQERYRRMGINPDVVLFKTPPEKVSSVLTGDIRQGPAGTQPDLMKQVEAEADGTDEKGPFKIGPNGEKLRPRVRQ